jgi:hypothetical protein
MREPNVRSLVWYGILWYKHHAGTTHGGQWR